MKCVFSSLGGREVDVFVVVAYDADTRCCRGVLWDASFLCSDLRNLFFSPNIPNFCEIVGSSVS